MSACLAQPLPAPDEVSVIAAPEQVASGTPLHVRLEQPIGIDISEVAQGFTATVVEPVYTSQGIVVIPPGATAIGTVTRLEATAPGQEATIGVRFDALRLFSRLYPVCTVSMERVLDPKQPQLEPQLDKGTPFRFELLEPIDMHAPIAQP